MAELSNYPAQERIFVDVFPPAYDTQHGTRYAGPGLSRPHQLWDYQWASPAPGVPPLEVQHTVAGSNPDRERVQLKNIAAMHDELQKRLDCFAKQGFKV